MKNEKLALLSCCAPCSVGAIRRLKESCADFVVLFYNPNISPRAEYDRRMDEQIKLCEKLGVEYVVGDYDHEEWLDEIKGLENEPERGARCEKCFRMRLKWGAKWARENGYDKITSVFGVSPHKDNAQVLRAAPESYADFNFPYSPDGDMYKQKYCGCKYGGK